MSTPRSADATAVDSSTFPPTSEGWHLPAFSTYALPLTHKLTHLSFYEFTLTTFNVLRGKGMAANSNSFFDRLDIYHITAVFIHQQQ